MRHLVQDCVSLLDRLTGIGQALFGCTQDGLSCFGGRGDDGHYRVHGVRHILADDLGDLVYERISLLDRCAGIDQALFDRGQEVPGGCGGWANDRHQGVDGVGHILAGQSQDLVH